jgi:membrane-associated phospholipid phosphatase
MIEIETANKSTNLSISEKLLNHKLFFISIILVFCFEILVRDYLFDISIPIILYLQKNYEYLFFIGRLVSFFCTFKGEMSVFLICFNFSNIYKAFIFGSTGLLSTFLAGFLKLFYLSPRPFYYNTGIISIGCEGGYGNPSNHAIVSFCYYLSFYYIFIKKNKNIKYKKLCLCLIIVFILCICFSRFYMGVHSLNQIFFGMFLGFSLYYFIFYVIEIEPKNTNDILEIIYNLYKYVLILIVILTIGLIPYFIFKLDKRLAIQYNIYISQFCPNIPNIKRLENAALLNITTFSITIIALIGINFEYNFIFNENINKFLKFNFYNEDNDFEKNLLNKNNNKKWNDTNLNKSIIRLIFVFTIVYIMNYYPKYISYQNNFYIVLFFKILFPLYIITFLLFTYIKQLTGLCNLNNENI